MQWVVRTADSVFLRDLGTEPVLSGQGAVEVPRVPDVVFERYGTVENPIRLATAQELQAVRDAQKDSDAARLADDIVAKAVARVAFEEVQKCTVRAGQTLRTWDEWRERVKALILNA